MNRKEYLLVVLAEECAEVIKNTSKALRFGLDDFGPNKKETNSQQITNELADVIGIMEMLIDEGLILPPEQLAVSDKKRKVEEYIKYARNKGIIVHL